jgi:hypothetical protein
MKKTKTQTQVVKEMLLAGIEVTGSNAYAETKKQCKCGTLNLHVVLRPLKKTMKIAEKWNENEKTGTRYKSFNLKKK